VGRDNGVSDAKLIDLPLYHESPLYDERERLVLEYADRITSSSEDVDDELFERLSSFYTPEELVELTCTVAYENFLSRFHHALLVESQGFCPIVPASAKEASATAD
jgi:alkylhydroperoxidase family enzyme